MARTTRAAEQLVRREAFVDAGLRLIQAKGYEQMSVQDVLDEVGASKGAFYHYFDSKRALLEATVERISDIVLVSLTPFLEDPGVPALQKLEGLFRGIAAWKTERHDLVLKLTETWLSDDNAIVREKFRRHVTARLVPLLARIIARGAEEGVFRTPSPEETARTVVILIQGFQEVAIDLLLARRADAIPFEQVERQVTTQLVALDRVLGLPDGTFTGLDRETLRVWFG